MVAKFKKWVRVCYDNAVPNVDFGTAPLGINDCVAGCYELLLLSGIELFVNVGEDFNFFVEVGIEVAVVVDQLAISVNALHKHHIGHPKTRYR